MENESIEVIQTEYQENTDIAIIAKASIANIEANKKAYEELRDKYKGLKAPDFTDPEFKSTLKILTQGSGALVKARTAAAKLGKQETDKLDKVKLMIKGAVEDLISITAETEKEIKAEKERAEQIVEEDKQEQIRLAEEKKQLRMFELTQIGMVTKEGYYQLGDMSITLMELIQSTEAQWEGKVAQVKVIYEAEQLRLVEEAQKEAERLAQEQRDREVAQATELAEKEALRLANEAKQAELDAARIEQDIMRAERAESRVDALKQRGFDGDLKVGKMRWGTFEFDASFIVDANKANWDSMLKEADDYKYEASQPKIVEIKPAATPPVVLDTQIRPLNGTAIKFTEAERESIIESVLVGENEVTGEGVYGHDVTVSFTKEKPYIDAKVGKGDKAPIFRIYVEAFLEEATAGITKEQVSATGDFEGTDFLFMVIKGK